MMEIKSWDALSADEQNLYLTLLWQDGYSEKAIADFFTTTKGRVVRRRNDLKLKNIDRPTGRQKVDPDRFRDLLDLHAMKQVEKETGNVVAIAPLGSCEWPLPSFTQREMVLCGKPVVPGHKLCEDHLPLALKSK